MKQKIEIEYPLKGFTLTGLGYHAMSSGILTVRESIIGNHGLLEAAAFHSAMKYCDFQIFEFGDETEMGMAETATLSEAISLSTPEAIKTIVADAVEAYQETQASTPKQPTIEAPTPATKTETPEQYINNFYALTRQSDAFPKVNPSTGKISPSEFGKFIKEFRDLCRAEVNLPENELKNLVMAAASKDFSTLL